MLKSIFHFFTILFLILTELVNIAYSAESQNNYKTSSNLDTCSYQWSLQTSGTTSQLNSVSTVSGQIGWAAGDGPTVRRTTNGGTSWGNATGTGVTGDIYSIYATNGNTAFCTTTPVPGTTPSFIYRTSNGGTTWTQVYATAVDGFIDAIQMISPSEGYALGDPLNNVWTFLKTTNGGVNWNQMSSAPAQIGSEAGYNNSLFILGSNIWFGTNSVKVYHSTNLGLNWSSGTTTGSSDSYAIHFNDVLTGLSGGLAMLSSTNSGSSYNVTTSPGVTGRINGIEGANTDWWAIRSGANVYRSTNHGQSWNIVYNLPSAVFNDLDFTAATGCSNGWVVGGSGIIIKMKGLIVGITNNESEIPSSYSLEQNFPNPFNPSTNINFSIPEFGFVSLKVYDVKGRIVETLINEFKNAGNYAIGFNATKLSSGTYFYKIETEKFSETKTMQLIK